MNKKLSRYLTSQWSGYIMAVILTALATWLKLLAQPDIIPADVPILYILAIVLTAAFYGLGPSIFCCGLSVIAFVYFFLPPFNSLTFGVQVIPISLIFLFTGLIISYLSHKLRQQTQKANNEIAVRKEKEAELETHHENLEGQVKQRTEALGKANTELKKVISRHELTEAALKRSESILDAFFESPGALRGVLELYADSEIRVIKANPMAAKFFGWDITGYENKLSEEPGFPPEIVRLWISNCKKCLESGQPVAFECEGRFKTGKACLAVTVSHLPSFPAERPRFAFITQDITEKKRTEEALIESEERFRIMADSSPLMIWVCGADGDIQFVNHAYTKFFGVTLEQVKGPNWQPLVHPEDAEKYVSEFNISLQQQKPFHAEARVRRADGEYRWIESFGTPRFSSSGKFLGIVGSSPDITDRKKAEEALKESRQRFMAAIRNTRLVLAEYDLNLRYTWIYNPHPDARVDSLVGKRDDEVENTESARKIAAFKQKVIDTKSGGREELVFIKEEGERTYEVIAEPLFNSKGEVTGGATSTFDITERKEAEKTLRETRDYLDNLFNYANAPIIVWNPRYEITRFNHAFEHITGLTAEEVIGKKIDILFPEDSHNESMAHIEEATFGTRWETVEIPIRHKDGTVRILLWNSSSLYDEQGENAITTIAQGQDITARIKAEQVKDDFISMVSHELRTPMMIVSGSLKTARQDGISQEDKDTLLQNAIDGADSLSAILENLLELSRYQAGRLQIHKEPISLPEVINNIIGDFAVRHEGYRFITEFPEGLPPVSADAMRVERILNNLLANAVKYSPEKTNIKVSAQQINGRIVIHVADEGRGIKAEHMEKIFEPFERLQSGENIQGLGLGLVVCKRLVEAQGGQIWVKSTPGKGSTFSFTLQAQEKTI